MIEATGIHFADTLALAAVGMTVGLLSGVLHFATLRWNLAYVTHRRMTRAFALQLARIALTATFFVLLAKAGVFVLLGGIGGFLWAREIALGLRRAAP